MRKLTIGLGCLALVACGTESSDVSDINTQLTGDGVYGTYVQGDVVIDFASFPDGAGGFDVFIDPVILDPDRIKVPTAPGAEGPNTILQGEQPRTAEPPPNDGTLDPVILDPDHVVVPSSSGIITVLAGESASGQTPPDPGTDQDVFDDFLFAIDTQLPDDHPAVEALRTAAALL